MKLYDWLTAGSKSFVCLPLQLVNLTTVMEAIRDEIQSENESILSSRRDSSRGGHEEGRPTKSLRKMEFEQSAAVMRELVAICQHLSTSLRIYEELEPYLPLDPENLLPRLRDGIILAYLLHHYYPESINPKQLARDLDLTQMDQPYSRVTYEVNSNLNVVIKACKSIKGLVVVNLGAEDILQGNRDLVLGLLWQIIHGRLLSDVSLQAHPELLRLAEAGESLVSLATLKPEALLLRWVNYHLSRAGTNRRVSNFGKDLADSEPLVRLLHAIAPQVVSEQDVDRLLAIDASTIDGRQRRAQGLLEYVKQLLPDLSMQQDDIAHGSVRLNCILTARLLNGHIGIRVPSEEEFEGLQKKLAEAHEEKTYWRTQMQTMESELGAQLETAKREIEQLKEELRTLQTEDLRERERLREQFESAKDELAAQYKDSLQSAMESERRQHQDELWEIVSEHKEVRRQLLMIHAHIKCQVRADDFDKTRLAEPHEDSELDEIVRALGEGVNTLCKRIGSMQMSLESLRNTVAHKEKVNEIMGEKIREYTELVITGKKSDNVRRGSLLKRIFANQNS